MNMKHWLNRRTVAEQQNNGRTIGIPQNSRTVKEQKDTGRTTEKQQQEIFIWTSVVLLFGIYSRFIIFIPNISLTF